MSRKFQVKRGAKVNLPILADGEFGLCTDTKELFIGSGGQNIQLANADAITDVQNKIGILSKRTETLIYLKDYENKKVAIADGYDWTPAFEEAIGNISPGSKVTMILPNHEDIILTKGIQLSSGLVGLKGVDGSKKATLKFKLPTNGDLAEDGLTFDGYLDFCVENVIIDMDNTGRDAICLISADRPRFIDVEIRNTYRHGFTVKCDKDFAWVENLCAQRLYLTNIGYHGFYFVVGDKPGNFFNESSFIQCEIRGISRNYNGGSFIYADCRGAAEGNKMSVFNWINCNFDAHRQGALDRGFDIGDHMIYLKGTAGKNSKYECWTIIGGGWESMDSGSKFTGKFVYADTNVIANHWFIRGVSIYNWTDGSVSDNVDLLGGSAVSTMRLPKIKTLEVENVLKTITDGIRPYISTDALERIKVRVTAEASKTGDIIIPVDLFRYNSSSDFASLVTITLVTNTYVNSSDPYYVMKQYEVFFHKRSWTSLAKRQVQKVNDGSSTLIVVNSIDYDITNKQLKINISTSSIFGTNNGEHYIYIYIDIYHDAYANYHYSFTL